MTKPITRKSLAEVAALMRPIWGDAEWREARNFSNHFVSSLGQIWSCRSQRLVTGCTSGAMKYRRIARKTVPSMNVHRIVCLTFHGEPSSPDLHVRHLDGNPSNNRADNLAWGTKSENEADKVRHGTRPRGDRCPASKLTSEEVRQMREIKAADRISYSALAKRFGVTKSTAHRAVTGENWSV